MTVEPSSERGDLHSAALSKTESLAASNSREAVSSYLWQSHIHDWIALQERWVVRLIFPFVAACLVMFPIYIIFIFDIVHKISLDHVILLFTVIIATAMMASALGTRTFVARREATEQKILTSLRDASAGVDGLGDVIRAYMSTRTESGRMGMQELLIDLLQSQCVEQHAQLTVSEQRLFAELIENHRYLPPLVPVRSHLEGTPKDKLRWASIQAAPIVGNALVLPALAHLAVQNVATPDERLLRDAAHEALNGLMTRLNFGTIEEIPEWISRLAYVNASWNSTNREGAFRYEGLTPMRIDPPMSGSWDSCFVAVCALTHLLPLLTPQHTGLLDRAARDRLKWAPGTLPTILTDNGMRNLNPQIARLGPEFRLAVLAAFEAIGDGDDLPYIQYWANIPTPTPDLECIRERAEEIVPILEARKRDDVHRLSLVRGASAPATQIDQLLRPATGQSTIEPVNELLRPHDAPSPVQETDASIANKRNNEDSASESIVSNGADTRAEGARPDITAHTVTETQPLLLHQNQKGK